MLYLVGFGLSSVDDLTLKAVSILKKCDFIYIDAYTSVAVDPYALFNLNKMVGKECIESDRKLVEQTTDIIYRAKENNVAFLVIGDPLSATTHIDMVQRAIIEDIPFEIVSNTSIMTAVGATGLCLYEFGRTVSIPLWDESGEPTSFYEKIEKNLSIGTHTLCLLDIKVKEQSLENLLKNNEIYEPARFMTCETAVIQIIQSMTRNIEKGGNTLLKPSHLAMGLARMGSPEQCMIVGSLDTFYKTFQEGPSEIGKVMGRPLHSLIVMGPLQASEIEHILLSVKKPRSSINQPQVFFNPNKKATKDEVMAVERLLHDHNLLCDSFITQRNKAMRCIQIPATKVEEPDCIAENEHNYKLRLL